MNEVYEEVKEDMKNRFCEEDVLIISQDGWSSVQNDPIIAHTVFSGNSSFLYNLENTGKNKKSAEYCFELLQNVINEITHQYDKKVFAVCTDNENKMVKMRQ